MQVDHLGVQIQSVMLDRVEQENLQKAENCSLDQKSPLETWFVLDLENWYVVTVGQVELQNLWEEQLGPEVPDNLYVV